ncbi:hypothetical protein A0H76_97 [Hepatospora eriocheir]|uniref:Uncharacterized protein n=1 Tax=Hepatospora eriocheir TaxID=1081669 RepID=A0A1X0QEM4_9MICR|nr:hypothetical protein A0H76_97 [Hepatospora eriocheir]
MRLISRYGDSDVDLRKEYEEPGKTIAKTSHRHRKQPRMHRNDTMTTEETLTVLDPPITVNNPNMSFDRSYYAKSKNSYKDDRKPYYKESHSSYSQKFNAQQIDSKRDDFFYRREIMSNNDSMMPVNTMSNIPMLSGVDNLTANPEINTMMGSDFATTATDVPMVSEMILDNGQTILAPDGLMMTSIDDEGDTPKTTSTAEPAADDDEDDSDEGSSNRSENGIKSILTLSGLGILALFSIL